MARRAYELAPDLPFASLVLGKMHMRAHNYAEAERCCRCAIRLGPGDAENCACLANVLSFAGRSEEAIKLLVVVLAHLGRTAEAAAMPLVAQAIQQIPIAERLPGLMVGLHTRADAPLTRPAAALARLLSDIGRRVLQRE